MNNKEDQEAFTLCKGNEYLTSSSKLELRAITMLDLTKCGINNFPDLRQLDLKTLILAENALEEIPFWLYSRLGNLEVLDLSYNLIKNFDMEPACRESIVVLKLNNNKLHNLPLWIWTLNCPKLKEVNYSNNYLKMIKPTVEVEVTKLAMCSSQVQPCDFSFLRKIKSLAELDLSNNSDAGVTRNRLGDVQKLLENSTWKRIRSLNFNNIVIGVLPADLFYYTCLVELHLENCQLSWVPPEIRYLNQLVFLNIAKNSIASLGNHLCNLPKLKIVMASFNCICCVYNFVSHLQILDLYNNQIEEFEADINRIDELDLELNPFDTNILPNYTRKRDDFRKNRYCIRGIGKSAPVSIPDDDEFSDHESNYSDEGMDEYCLRNVEEAEEEECWDDEENTRKIQNNLQSHPDVTESDDEWSGIELVEHKVQIPRYYLYDRDEDWIFSDFD